MAITNIAAADSFQLAKSFGLNLQNYAKLVAVSTGKSWASVDNCPIPGVYQITIYQVMSTMKVGSLPN